MNKGDSSILSNLWRTHPSIYSKGKVSLIQQSRYLTGKQVTGLFQFAEAAYQAQQPLNRFITIHMKDLKNKRPQELLSNLMEKTRKWLQRNGFEHQHLWVIENGELKGIHAHILLRIPPNYIWEYKKLFAKWLPFEKDPDTLDFKTVIYPVWGTLDERSRLYGVLRYICKGLHPLEAMRGINPKYQGIVYGRRCGTSKSKLHNMKSTI